MLKKTQRYETNFIVFLCRYDLLCVEGLGRSLRVFLEKDPPPTFTTVVPTHPQEMRVTKDVNEIRQFVVCAVLRDLTFTKSSYDSFIELQEKLHQNICRYLSKSVQRHFLQTSS